MPVVNGRTPHRSISWYERPCSVSDFFIVSNATISAAKTRLDTVYQIEMTPTVNIGF